MSNETHSVWRAFTSVRVRFLLMSWVRASEAGTLNELRSVRENRHLFNTLMAVATVSTANANWLHCNHGLHSSGVICRQWNTTAKETCSGPRFLRFLCVSYVWSCNLAFAGRTQTCDPELTMWLKTKQTIKGSFRLGWRKETKQTAGLRSHSNQNHRCLKPWEKIQLFLRSSVFQSED